MREIKTVEEKIVYEKSEVTVAITCDICGERFLGANDNYGDGIRWDTEYYAIDDTIVSWETGNNWPDGRCTTAVSAHICPDCFESKLIPFIFSFGKVDILESKDKF